MRVFREVEKVLTVISHLMEFPDGESDGVGDAGVKHVSTSQ
jgi:hypothetical protein